MKTCNRIPCEDNESLVSKFDEDTEALLALSGTWEDKRPIETIIKDIYESRTGGNLKHRDLKER